MANTQQRVTNITGNGQFTPACNVSEYRTLVVDVSGTFVATVQVQTSINGTTWRNITGGSSVLNLSTGGYMASGNITAAGLYAVDISSYQYVRFISTAYTSGTAILEYATVTTGNLAPSGATVTATGTVTANQGTLATGTAISVTTAASTNASVQKSASGNLFEITASNPTATAAYLKLYNKAAAPTVGTDVPVMTIPVAANSFVSYVSGGQGKRFTTGIAIAVTGAITAADTTASVAGVQVHGTYI